MGEEIQLKCPICGGTTFRKEEGKIDSKWGFTAHKVLIFICNECVTYCNSTREERYSMPTNFNRFNQKLTLKGFEDLSEEELKELE